MPFDHAAHVGREPIQVAVQQVQIHTVAERAVVFVLPVVVADLHDRAIAGEQCPARLFVNRCGAVEIHVVVGTGVV